MGDDGRPTISGSQSHSLIAPRNIGDLCGTGSMAVSIDLVCTPQAEDTYGQGEECVVVPVGV